MGRRDHEEACGGVQTAPYDASAAPEREEEAVTCPPARARGRTVLAGAARERFVAQERAALDCAKRWREELLETAAAHRCRIVEVHDMIEVQGAPADVAAVWTWMGVWQRSAGAP